MKKTVFAAIAIMIATVAFAQAQTQKNNAPWSAGTTVGANDPVFKPGMFDDDKGEKIALMYSNTWATNPIKNSDGKAFTTGTAKSAADPQYPKEGLFNNGTGIVSDTKYSNQWPTAEKQ
jgi:hypothetical protein